MKFDGVIFDIDGVLVDVSESYREAVRLSAGEFLGREVSTEEVEEVKGIPGMNNDWDAAYALVRGMEDAEGIERDSGEYLKVKERFQELYLGGLRDRERMLVEGETLEGLKSAGVKLGVVTGRPREEALYALRGLIPEFFKGECIIAMEDCEYEKPDARPLRLAVERMGCGKPIYVGDSVNDGIAARNAGMPFVSVVEGLEADYYIKNVNCISEVLE